MIKPGKYFFLAFFFLYGALQAQPEIPLNEYGLKVVSDISLYHELVALDSSNALLDLEILIPNLKKDVKYATTDNVTKHILYETPGVFLRLPAAHALRNVAAELALNGIGLVIYDGYRPYAVTKKIWEFVLDEDFAASPKTGSRHNRGCAIDLGLYDLKTGELLEMPTVFDEFTPKAGHGYQELPLSVRANRALLRSVMEKHGFQVLESEWWHYDFRDWKKFDLMDIPFTVLRSPK